MREIALLTPRHGSEVVFLSTGVLGDDPVIVQAVQRDLMVDMGHVPMDPSAAHLVVESIDGCVPCAASESVSGFQEKCCLSWKVLLAMTVWCWAKDGIACIPKLTLGGQVSRGDQTSIPGSDDNHIVDVVFRLNRV